MLYGSTRRRAGELGIIDAVPMLCIILPSCLNRRVEVYITWLAGRLSTQHILTSLDIVLLSLRDWNLVHHVPIGTLSRILVQPHRPRKITRADLWHLGHLGLWLWVFGQGGVDGFERPIGRDVCLAEAAAATRHQGPSRRMRCFSFCLDFGSDAFGLVRASAEDIRVGGR